MAPTAAQDAPDADRFQRDAERVVTELRDHFAAVIETAIGRVETAQEISERFGIHRKLGWQIAKVAYGDEPLHAARHIPSQRGLRRWLEAAAERDVPQELLDRVEEAADGFERLIEVHCRDRETLEMMLESCGPRVDGAAEARWRREAFLGNSYIFGVRTGTLLSLTILAPSQRPGYLDIARVHGLLGFLRSRPDVRWVIAQTAILSGPGSTSPLSPRREPLDPEAAAASDGVPLLGEHCSSPLPKVQRREGAQGIFYDELLAGPVGQIGEQDLVTGEVLRAVAPAHATHEGEVADFGPAIRTPAESLVSDLLVHRDLFAGATPALHVYGQLFSPVSREQRDRLVVGERVQPLGRGLGRIHSPEVPHYSALAADALERLGLDAQDFDLHRVRMRYPPLPSSVMFHLAMPPRQGPGE